jgi:hypothetical protein
LTDAMQGEADRLFVTSGGAGAQVYTGRKKNIPAETELSFKLAQDLEMRPVRSTTKDGLKTR